MNILIVDDEPTDLKLAEKVLALDGHVIRTASSPAEAERAVVAGRPDLILLDLKFPGGNSLALLQKLKREPQTRDIPVVAVTAFPDEFNRHVIMQEGCDAYITKPISTRNLSEQVDTVYSQRSGKPKKKTKG